MILIRYEVVGPNTFCLNILAWLGKRDIVNINNLKQYEPPLLKYKVKTQECPSNGYYTKL